MEFGAKLATLRKRHGLSQMELAEKLHVSRQAISRWEVGKAQPSMDNIRALCQLFDISIDDLFTEDSSLSCSSNKYIKQQSPMAPDESYQNAPTKNRGNHKLLIAIISVGLILMFCITASVLNHRTQNDNKMVVSGLEHDTIQPIDEEPAFQLEW